MKQKIILSTILVFIVFATVVGVKASCKYKDSTTADDDSEMPILNDNFDPCDNWRKWTVTFYRNGNTDGSGEAYLKFEMQSGSGQEVMEEWRADDYQQGTHTFTETENIGASNTELLYMETDTLSRIFFEDITATAEYFATNPD